LKLLPKHLHHNTFPAFSRRLRCLWIIPDLVQSSSDGDVLQSYELCSLDVLPAEVGDQNQWDVTVSFVSDMNGGGLSGCETYR